MQFLRVLLVNPPIFDFTAYDFWLRPYGMLRVAGRMQHSCELLFFDFLTSRKRDQWGRGRFECTDIPRPHCFNDIPRKFHRFGRPREEFRAFLKACTLDAVLIQTGMTYWYLGVQEVIEDVRELHPQARIIIGGVYATLCPQHAQSLGPDCVIEGANLKPLWDLLSIEPAGRIPYWPDDSSGVGVMKISEGCPFRCTYCSAPLFWLEFLPRPTRDCHEEVDQLIKRGVRNIAFYDDALLFRSEQVLEPFLEGLEQSGIIAAFHTPNALNARFITSELARRMVRAGFASFFLGLESRVESWQHSTGGKVDSSEFAAAATYLRESGAQSIGTYILVGHSDSEGQDLESSIRFAHQCGTKVLLSEFSPVPGTVDGEKCRPWADLSEPLSHNKTAFAIRRLGADRINYLKQLAHSLNRIPAGSPSLR